MGGVHKHRGNINLQNATARVLNSAVETFQEETQRNSKITLESFSQTFFSWQKSMEHGPDDVQQVHLAMMDEPTQMRVTFATGKAYVRDSSQVYFKNHRMFW